jgi:hypothetical protein
MDNFGPLYTDFRSRTGKISVRGRVWGIRKCEIYSQIAIQYNRYNQAVRANNGKSTFDNYRLFNY